MYIFFFTHNDSAVMEARPRVLEVLLLFLLQLPGTQEWIRRLLVT